MKNKLVILPIGILLIFSFFGMIIFSVASHELLHKHDLKDYVFGEEEICILNLPTGINSPLGYYKYYTNESKETKELTIYLEKRAYSLSIFLIVLWFACVGIVLWKWSLR